MLFGMLLCISFSKAVLWLTKYVNDHKYEIEKFSGVKNDMSFVTKAVFFRECDARAMKLLESGELTGLKEIAFSHVTNETGDKCMLLKCLNDVKNTYAKENAILKLTVHVKELSQDHLNSIEKLSYIKNLEIYFFESEENLNLSLTKLGQNLKFFIFEHLKFKKEDKITKITFKDCEKLTNLKKLFILNLNFEFDETVFGNEIRNLCVEFKFPGFDITTIKELLKNREELGRPSILQNREKSADIQAECPNPIKDTY